MQTRKLGQTDLELTVIGLGTWAIGGPWQFGWGPQDDGEAVAAILRALELGINWIDTAPAYGVGHAEELVGRALEQTDHKPIIATKCGILWDQKKQKISCLKEVQRECEQSLRRLGVEAIDLYQMHWPDPAEDVEQAWCEMARLKEQGKVRHIGVCNFNVEQLQLVGEIHPVASLQPPYSMIHREVEGELLGYCRDHGIGVVVYSPMQRGLLTGKFSPERLAELPLDDHRRRNADFHEPAFSATLELVEKLRPIAERSGRTPAQLAISWVLRRDEITSAIVGARRPEQIEETAAAGDWRLGAEEIDQIEHLLAERQARLEAG